MKQHQRTADEKSKALAGVCSTPFRAEWLPTCSARRTVSQATRHNDAARLPGRGDLPYSRKQQSLEARSRRTFGGGNSRVPHVAPCTLGPRSPCYKGTRRAPKAIEAVETYAKSDQQVQPRHARVSTLNERKVQSYKGDSHSGLGMAWRSIALPASRY